MGKQQPMVAFYVVMYTKIASVLVMILFGIWDGLSFVFWLIYRGTKSKFVECGIDPLGLGFRCVEKETPTCIRDDEKLPYM